MYEEEKRVPGPMVSITFDLSDSGQEFIYDQMKQAEKLYGALTDVSDMLRSIDKYCVHPVRNDELTIEESDIVGHIRDRFHEIVADNGADLS